MNKYQIEKGYLFFETVYKDMNNKELQSNYNEWFHKENIKDVYIIVDNKELAELNEVGFINANDILLFSNKKHAMEELNEYN